MLRPIGQAATPVVMVEGKLRLLESKRMKDQRGNGVGPNGFLNGGIAIPDRFTQIVFAPKSAGADG